MSLVGTKMLGLRSAFPGVAVPQDNAFEEFFGKLYNEIPGAKKLFASSRVRQRHMAWDPRVVYNSGFPGMAERMRAWEHHTLALGRETLKDLLDDVDRDRIGTFVMVSCTGYAGPGPEFLLANEFGLRRDLRRTFIGHMGCSAAFNAIKVAMDAVQARPDELALILCSEVNSVHVRPEITKEQAVIHSLFGDAATAMLLSAADDSPGPTFVRTHTENHYGTSHATTWCVEDTAFRMTLSPYVPVYVAEAIEPFVRRLIESEGLSIKDIRHWGIHPGGPKIVNVVGDRLALSEDQLAPALRVLAECGNCSSPTVLMVLDDILRNEHPAPGEYGVLMAFSPGLTMESALVRF